MDTWTPGAIADAALKIGTPLAVFVGVVYVLGKLLDALKARWSRRD